MLGTIAIVQARMGSTRLPGKVLLPLAGVPMLRHVIERVRRATRVDHVLVATTTEAADEAIATFCAEWGCACFRGSEHDLLDRYYQAARTVPSEVVVRITSDCPLVDPGLIDRVLAEREEFAADYASNTYPVRTYPRGLCTEAFRFAALERAWGEAPDSSSREHVTPYIYRNPDRFHIHNVTNEEDCSAHRWTVDTVEDYALVERIYGHFGHNRFDWKEALALLAANPAWSELNAQVGQKAH
ncbi:MAG: spore coat polysaccharide biosynthesis protein SpsF [Chthoniobacter sp.]|jgi:spore coat polysaccharide biosynthesis protein SpsF|nr:spore coat polysaccharide biosynthesis protein SpsF [Chthoniobacter sp.]